MAVNTPQPWVTGPAHIYVAPGVSALYFGTTENTPDIDLKPEYEDVPNDLRGQRKPMDKVYEGEDGFVSVVMTRWNEQVYEIITDYAAIGAAARTPGRDPAGKIGTLMITEGASYPLFVTFPFATRPAMAGLPPGYHFYAAMLVVNRHPKLGTGYKNLRLMWYCGALADGAGGWNCYDFNTAGLPAPT